MESRRENDQGHYELAGQTYHDRKDCQENHASQEKTQVVKHLYCYIVTKFQS